MNCVARVSDDGKSAEVWTGTQSNFLATLAGAGVLKTTPNMITVHQHLLGGGFGRRIAPDAVAQAIALANATKQTVKLMLTREDDLAAARPRPMTYQLLKAGLETNGRIVGWHHRMVAENVDAIAAPPRFKATGGKDLIGWRGMEQLYYDIPNILADGVRETRGMRVQPGGASVRATPSSRPKASSMKSHMQPARIRSPCVWSWRRTSRESPRCCARRPRWPSGPIRDPRTARSASRSPTTTTR